MNIVELKLLETSALYPLWEDTMGSAWPITEAAFHEELRGKKIWVCEQGGSLIGFVALGCSGRPQDLSIHSMGVLTAYRRRGIGTEMFAKAVGSSPGFENISVGSGGGSYFWPGIPANLPSALSFFRKLEFDLYESSYDLVLDLNRYEHQTHDLRLPGVQLHLSDERWAEKILAFEQTCFPDWYLFFESAVSRREFSSILLASSTETQQLIGAAMLFGPENHKWSRILGPLVGGFGVLGVHPEWREKGIGLAMAAQATSLLKARGVKTSFVGWTWLVDWYGRLGYAVFQEYKMARRSMV